jgi:formylglycine-generating enzyme required for sulfatase activity
VINVTWNDAVALCEWLTSNDGRGTYRLPTEAEWEYACRAGSTTSYSFGDDPAELTEHGWFSDNSEGRFQTVALKRANPFGIHDMYGNRQEWCLDNYAVDFYSRSPSADPVSAADGNERVMRGGAHTDTASFCTSARRWNQDASNPGAAGIRVVLETD